MPQAIGFILLIIVGVVAVWDASNGFVVLWRRVVLLAAILVGIGLLVTPAHSRDAGQWENSDPAISRWFRSLEQPDNPPVSCCGEADAYWCDTINVKAGKTFCTITDDRDDAPLHRMHVPVGTVIEIPDHKLTWKDGNPTGHAIVFLSRQMYVYCFVQGTGI